MLGSLARWLRILGYDTIYFKNISDKEILEYAAKEGRVVLTRDYGLYRRARKNNLKAIYFETSKIDEMLTILAKRYGISLLIDPNRTRCPICNSDLKKVSQKEVKGKVPDIVLREHSDFWVCGKCGKIYWKGTHWITMEKTLSKVREQITRGE